MSDVRNHRPTRPHGHDDAAERPAVIRRLAPAERAAPTERHGVLDWPDASASPTAERDLGAREAAEGGEEGGAMSGWTAPAGPPGGAGDAAQAARTAAEERDDARTPPRLGEVLREARERTGLGLSDLAEVTHVRRAYLDALEGGRYAELPEDVYTRNFLRLYAQAVSLDVDAVLQRYLLERRGELGLTTFEQRLERDRRATSTTAGGAAAPFGWRGAAPPAWLTGPWLPTVVLVVIVVGMGLWGFNQLLSRPVAPAGATGGSAQASPAAPSPAAPVSAPAVLDPAAAAGTPDTAAGGLAAPALIGPGGAASLAQVRVDVHTVPAGASVTIDNFPIPGRTPLTGIPVTGRDGRMVRAELDGYEPLEIRADLTTDARIDMTLTPIGSASPAPVEPGLAAAAGGRIGITVTDTTWLEIYRSTERNVGERLVYTTAQSGASFSFEPPIYVYVGNAAGVRVTQDGQELGPMGSPGAVLGRAFPQ
jgi:cytoskeleton protein RodZ